MREFFNGWRPKAGCVTLLMACALSCAWIRSLYVFDRLEMEISGTVRLLLFSDANVLILLRDCTRYPDEIGVDTENILWSPYPKWSSVAIDSGDEFKLWGNVSWDLLDHVRWDWHWSGFGVGEQPLSGSVHDNSGNLIHLPNLSTIQIWLIPYWAIVISLTLLSAYLLVSKPRLAKRPTDAIS